MNVIEASGISRHYGTGRKMIEALRSVDLVVGEGEFLAIVGRSGSGKTTLLDILGLLLRPTAGRLVVEGRDTMRLSETERARMRSERIGFVFQGFDLLPHLSVFENVLLPARYMRRRPSGAEARALELLSEVGLRDRANAWPNDLSGGERQRVAIARALIAAPAIVLADEPTGELDSVTRDQIIQLMRQLNRDQRTTFLVVTHDQSLARAADRCVRIDDGGVRGTSEIPPTSTRWSGAAAV